MEVTKYLCEFFFTNFWHWLGLVVILAIVFRFGIVSFGNKFTEINRGNKDKENMSDDKTKE